MANPNSQLEGQVPSTSETPAVPRRKPLLGMGLPDLLGQQTAPARAPDKSRPTTRTGLQFKRMFHERLRAARVAAQLDEVAVARGLGLSTDAYIDFESISLPPHHLIPELCEILHITANDLFGMRDVRQSALAQAGATP